MGDTKTIVIVEDNAELSRMYERVFRLQGYNVVVYDDGEKALQGLTSGELPAAIIMDVIIPKMSGLDLLRNVRGDHRFDPVPILILTNSFVEANAQQFLSQGADLYLVKIEHEAADIVQNVETLIQKHTASQKTVPPLSNNKVFLVEDDEYISRVYERAFRLVGFDLANAVDGEVALRDLTKMDPLPSVIILDLGLPKMSGEELLKSIRSDARYRAVPVVILTNSFHKSDTQRLLSLGASLFLVKIDNTPIQIVEKISELIHRGYSPPEV